jgi:hypothetical protein
MNVIAVYISLFFTLAAFLQYIRAIQKASAIEYSLHIGDEGYQWIDNLSLHRLVLRLKLSIRLIMNILCLVVYTNRLYPVLIPFQTVLITYASLLFSLCMLLDATIVYLIYSKNDFQFLKIKKETDAQQS